MPNEAVSRLTRDRGTLASRLRWGLAWAVGIAFAVWAFVRWRAGQVTFDDSLISFRYAENLVHGRGLVYNAGERVEGYTNFLWVLVAAAAIRLGSDPLAATRAAGVGAYMATVVLAALIASRPVLPFRRARLACVALVALLVLPSGLAPFAGTGLETSFVALIVVAIGVVHHLASRPGRAHWALAAFLPLVAVLTRLDVGLALAASALASAVHHLRSRLTVSSYARHMVSTFGLAALGLAAFIAWKRVYYGDFVPNTFYAKAADHSHVDAGLAYVVAFVQSYPSVMVLVMLAASGLFTVRSGPRASFLVYAATACALHVAYVIRVGGDFMEYRFMWKYWPLLVCAAIVGAEGIGARAVPVIGAALAIGVAVVPTILEKRFGMRVTRGDERIRRHGQGGWRCPRPSATSGHGRRDDACRDGLLHAGCDDGRSVGAQRPLRRTHEASRRRRR